MAGACARFSRSRNLLAPRLAHQSGGANSKGMVLLLRGYGTLYRGIRNLVWVLAGVFMDLRQVQIS